MAFRTSFCSVLLLMTTIAWQRVASNVGCVSDKCFCFPEGDIECGESFLTRVPRLRQVDNTTVYNYIDLSLNRIRKVDAKAFRNIRVKTIKIWQNRGILSINGRAFRGLEDSLEVISIRETKLSELASGLFKGLWKLNKIDLFENRVSAMQRGVFRGASGVDSLNLAKNRLESLGERVFSGLVNLKTLQLGRNHLTFIDTKALSSLTKLEQLDLRNNKLRDLQPRGFSRLFNLRRLDMSSNRMSALFPQMFEGLRNLETLVLARNPISFIARGSFVGMSNLRELVLSKNKLTTLKPGAFEGLDSLHNLVLGDNSITALLDDVFSGLKSLNKVQLDYNKLTTINACAFDNATAAVGELSIEGNPLHCDCAVAWTSVSGKSRAMNVHGKCKTPAFASGQDISQGDKFHVCRYIGTEHCKTTSDDSPTSVMRNNESIQPTDRRYKRRNG